MGKSSHKSSSSSGHTNCASCIVATIFLIFIAIILLILFFTLFKPKDPKLTVNTIQLPTFTLTNGTINFKFSQYVTVKNPNRSLFTHYDSSLQLIYSGNQVGFMFIPAGKIESGRTEYMTLSFTVDSFPLFAPGSAAFVDGGGVGGGTNTNGVGPVIEFQSRMKVGGRVSVLQFFTHHVEASARCSVAISVNDGSVLGFHC